MIYYVIVLILISPAVADNFFMETARGWHWYESLPVIDEEEAESQKAISKTPSQTLKAYQDELEKRLHTAWVSPTSKNIQAYQEMQKDMVDRAKLFSTRWMQNVFSQPELDHTLVSPVNHQARHVKIDQEKQKIHQTIQGLSQEYGLFFFFSSDCLYCHQFAPIVKQFSQLYGWEVMAISLDGGSIADFPEAQPDNGLSQIWDIKSLPSLYAVNPRTQEAVPIAQGLTSLDEMETRIMTLIGDHK